MNDTHGAAGKGWYGFDLDGTLAKYDKWEGIDRIGEPVKPMVDLIKRMHEKGETVKILTARVAPRTLEDGTVGIQRAMVPVVNLNEYLKEPKSPFDLVGNKTTVELNAKQIVEFWCEKHLGFVPEITHEKDHLMIMLFDDRVKQVIPNEGLLVEDLYMDLGKKVKQMYADNGWLAAKVESKKNGFWAGFMLCVLLTFLVQIGCDVYNRYFVERTPDQVRMKQAHDALCDLLREWPVDWTPVDEINTNGVYRLEVR